jgi:choline dehydrogenase
MMYVRCNKSDYDLLAKRGGHQWNKSRIRSALARLENYLDGPAPDRFDTGMMYVRNCPDPNAYSLEFQHAARELGYEGDDWDYNGPVQQGGAGPLQFNIGLDGKRHSAFNAYLEPILTSDKLEVRADYIVERILFDEDKCAHGVAVRNKDGDSRTLKCRGDVIIAAGALGSPKILLDSGIGPQEDLRAAGMEVISDSPWVGKNLTDHLQLPVIVRLSKPIPEPTLLTGNVLFLNLNNNSPHKAPDLQLNFTPAAPKPLQRLLPPLGGPVMIFLPILIQPRSSGELKLEANREVSIDPRYLSHDSDVEVFLKALQVIRKLCATEAFSGHMGEEIAPGQEDPEKYIRNNATTLWHPVGTCALGSDIGNSVVGADLRVHGVGKLRVCDASVTPYATAGNNHVPTMIMAEIGASILLEGD